MYYNNHIHERKSFTNPEELLQYLNEHIEDMSFNDYELPYGFRLSIVTCSHYDSRELRTVEIALCDHLKGIIKFKEELAIIHYMPLDNMKKFLNKMNSYKNRYSAMKYFKRFVK